MFTSVTAQNRKAIVVFNNYLAHILAPPPKSEKFKNQPLIVANDTKIDIIQKFVLMFTVYATSFRWNT